MERDIIVIGGGHAAAQFCIGMAAAGHGARIRLVCEEPILPYQRPPLSKSFLRQPEEEPQLICQQSWYAEAGIEVLLGTPALSIDRRTGGVALADGRVLPFTHAVLATGMRARVPAGLPALLDNVVQLRTAADAHRLRRSLAKADHVVVLGGGFIGLEVAATARALGRQVTLLEAAPRLLPRSLSPEMAEHVLLQHRTWGIDIRLDQAATGFEVAGNRLKAVRLGDRLQPVELLLSGIGAVPETELAQAAGLDCCDGVLVDDQMRTSDPRILAIGDCARPRSPHRTAGQSLQSLHNAKDQARIAAASVLGGGGTSDVSVPCFWSEQGSLRLQMAGCMPAQSTRFQRPSFRVGSFSILHYNPEGRLACVESMNAPHDHLAARRLLDTGRSPEPQQAANPAVALKDFL